MLSRFRLLVLSFAVLTLSIVAVANTTLSGSVYAYTPNQSCSNSATSSGVSVSINLDCSIPDPFGASAHVNGNAGGGSGFITSYGESSIVGTGGVASFDLSDIENFTFVSAQTATLDIIAGASVDGVPPSFGFSFDGTTVSDPGRGEFLYTFLLDPGKVYPFMLTASALNAGTNGNVEGATFEYNLSFSPAPVPEPGTLVLLGTGVLGAAGVLRRKYIAF